MAERKLLWDIDAWNDYLYWQENDKKTLKRVNLLIKDICRSPYEGLGKPEALKENLSGFWSRRIDSENRKEPHRRIAQKQRNFFVKCAKCGKKQKGYNI